MKKRNLNKWLSIFLSAMVIAGTIALPVLAETTDASNESIISQDYNEESLSETTDQSVNEADEMMDSEITENSDQGSDEDTLMVTDEAEEVSTGITSGDTADVREIEDEAIPTPDEYLEQNLEEADSDTYEEENDIDYQDPEEQESNSIDEYVTEEQEEADHLSQIQVEAGESDALTNIVEGGQEETFSSESFNSADKDTCTVTYDANGGGFIDFYSGNEIEFRIGDCKVEYGNCLPHTNCVIFTRESNYVVVNEDVHKIFVGWSLTKNGPPLDDSYKVYSDITLYAVWEDAYSVVLDGNGGHLILDNEMGYINFYNRVHPVSNGIRAYVFKSNDKEWLSQHIITGGLVSLNEDEYVNQLILPTQPERPYGIENEDESVVFAGWGLSKSGNNVGVTLTDDEDRREYHMGSGDILTYKPTSDCTLYALWKPYIDVEFNANGGHFSICYDRSSNPHYPPTIDKFTTKTPQGGKLRHYMLDFPDFGKAGESGEVNNIWINDGNRDYNISWDDYVQLINDNGKTFAGWSTSQNGSSIVDTNSFAPTKKCTLYAVWKLTNGWAKDSNGWYWLDASGNITKSKWIKSGGSWYYLGADGIMTTGWQKVGGKWYYMNSSGIMTTGWQKVGGKWYYMNSSGIMTTGWQKVGGSWYYMNSSGVMTTGWQKIGGKWYYMKSSGIMTTGWQTISGKWYYFDASGVWVR